MLEKGWAPSDSTMGPLFSAVASSQPADKCIAMLKVGGAGRRAPAGLLRPAAACG